MRETYKITVEFTRDIGDDTELLDAREAKNPGKRLAVYAKEQMHAEIQLAYDQGHLAGTFEVMDCDLKSDAEIAEEKAFDEHFPMLARQREALNSEGGRYLSEFLDYLIEEHDLRSIYRPQEILEKYFEIDGKKLEAERQELYELFRKNPFPVVVVEKP